MFCLRPFASGSDSGARFRESTEAEEGRAVKGLPKPSGDRVEEAVVGMALAAKVHASDLPTDPAS